MSKKNCCERKTCAKQLPKHPETDELGRKFCGYFCRERFGRVEDFGRTMELVEQAGVLQDNGEILTAAALGLKKDDTGQYGLMPLQSPPVFKVSYKELEQRFNNARKDNASVIRSVYMKRDEIIQKVTSTEQTKTRSRSAQPATHHAQAFA